ncbi:MAG: hypothetical protein KKG94_04920, partial [Nanoarchaeota archaeon]|nr:hypothetical protein [Nanoarchaeota archaeon]
SPNISLISPADSLISQNVNQTFSCNASDDFELSNITFYLWNSTAGIYNQTTANVSGTFNQTSFNITNISSGSYEWNCLAYDINNNSAFASSNFSLQIGNISVSLNSPLNNTFTNQNQTFNCSVKTNIETGLLNITFYLWNSTGLIYNLSENISGTSNSTFFEYNLTDELDFYWNCEAYNNLSENSFAENNYTITYDVSFPNITLVSPADAESYSSNSQQITFQYNVSDNYNIENCSLISNDAISSTNSSITNLSLTQSFTSTFTPGTYNWKINCTDKAGNQNASAQRSFTVTALPTTISSGGGGGGSSSSFQTYKPSVEQISEGYAKELREKDKMEFSLSKENIEKHTLTLNDVEENFVNITIQSNLIEIILGIGQDAKLNLTSPDYYDLYVKLENIVNKKANITIQTINEKILKQPTRTIHEESLNETKEQDSEEEIKSLNSGTEKLKIIIYILMLIFIIAFIFILLRKLDKKNEITKTINERE